MTRHQLGYKRGETKLLADSSPGYHFNIIFSLRWSEVVGAVVRRARRCGLDTDVEADLEPLVDSISLTGTRRLRYRSGGLRFDVTAYRRDLRASVVQAMGLHGKHPQRFGLAHVDRLRSRFGWNEFQLEGAVGLWLEGVPYVF